jgi:hypothetical protein
LSDLLKRAALSTWRAFRRLPRRAQAAAWVVLVILVLAAAGSGGTKHKADSHPAAQTNTTTPALTVAAAPSTAAKAKAPTPFHATNVAVAALIQAKLGADVADSNLPRIRSVDCTGRLTCVINYNADTPLWKAEKTLLEEARPIWKALFSDKKLLSAKIVPWGETTSIGGKRSRSPVMRVTCDRQADRQIDWKAVDSHGIEALCDYERLVRFS